MTFWIDNEQCIDCRLCTAECPEGGIRIEFENIDNHQKGLYFVIDEKCTECIDYKREAKCAYVCPTDCIIHKPEDESILWERVKLNKNNLNNPPKTIEKDSFFKKFLNSLSS